VSDEVHCSVVPVDLLVDLVGSGRTEFNEVNSGRFIYLSGSPLTDSRLGLVASS